MQARRHFVNLGVALYALLCLSPYSLWRLKIPASNATLHVAALAWISPDRSVEPDCSHVGSRIS